MVPSVSFINDIPTEITGSWYTGQVFYALKESAFEPSSPIRHVTEFADCLDQMGAIKPVLLLYTDGGPDHRLTYLSVQASFIALFRKLDLDYLCAARTAPCHSWKNPVERIMSIFNLGLQSVGLMRASMDSEYEKDADRCKNMGDLRAMADKKREFRESTLDSVAPVKILLSNLFNRLQLKGEPFKSSSAASESAIDDIWKCVQEVEPSLTRGEPLRKGHLSQKEAFLDHCCTLRHYFFVIKKCGSFDCSICRPPSSSSN